MFVCFICLYVFTFACDAGQALQKGTTADDPEKKETSQVSQEDRLGFLLPCAVKAWPQGRPP